MVVAMRKVEEEVEQESLLLVKKPKKFLIGRSC
jgi:hypothetical protein